MKLKYFLSLILAPLFVVACSDEETIGTFSDISVDQTYVIIPQEGGDFSVNLTAAADWAFADIFQTITKNADGSRDTTYAPLPSWLSVNQTSGGAGQTTLIFHADSTDSGRSSELQIISGTHTQFLAVRQGSTTVSEATCAEIIAGPNKTYRVTGTITAIANTRYGNMYIADETGSVYIYGTNDKDGKKGNNPIDSWGLEVGDIVTVEGPKQLYNTTVELVDVTVINIVKSLLKIETPDAQVGIEGGEVAVKLAYKGKGAYTTMPKDCDWLRFVGTEYKPGTPSDVEENPADTAIVRFSVEPNTGAGRKAAIQFSSTLGESVSTLTWNISQAAFVLPHGQTPDDPFTVAEAIAKCIEVGATATDDIYYAKGIISSIKEVSTSYGNATFNISDDGSDEGAITCYRSYSLDNQKFTAEDEIGVGDEVIICGKLVNYKEEIPEFSGSVYIYSRKSAAEANKPGSRLNPFTPEQANAFILENLEPGQTTEEDYYVSGEIALIDRPADNPTKNLFGSYGNATFYISEDGDPSSEMFYAYRTLYLGNRKWVEGDTQIAEGDAVVICGKLTLYQNKEGQLIPETSQNNSYICSLNGQTE